jgi:hypothetical protein
MSPKLPLPTAERTAVFRAIVRLLKADPTLSNVVKTWFVWDGTPGETQDFELGHAPALRLTPLGGGDEWMSPQSVVGMLVIDFEMMVAGTNIDDLANLWRAVIAAFYDPQALPWPNVQEILRDAGGYPPSPQFTLPSQMIERNEAYCHGSARLMIKVLTQLGSRGAVRP